jgi:hypothetical protein
VQLGFDKVVLIRHLISTDGVGIGDHPKRGEKIVKKRGDIESYGTKCILNKSGYSDNII